MKHNKRIFALGFFDGVHLGHQSLLSECVRLAEELDCEKMVWQIITDLRYARFQHLEGKEGAAGIYAYYLLIIAGIMRETGNYTERIETSAIGYEDYEALCRKMGLRL